MLAPRVAASSAAGALAATLASSTLSPASSWWASAERVPFVHDALSTRIEHALVIGVFGMAAGWLATEIGTDEPGTGRARRIALPLLLVLGPLLALAASLLRAPTDGAPGAMTPIRVALLHAAIVLSAGSVAALTGMLIAGVARTMQPHGGLVAGGISVAIVALTTVLAPEAQGAMFSLVACVPLALAAGLETLRQRAWAGPLCGAVAVALLAWSGLRGASAWEAERLLRTSLPSCPSGQVSGGTAAAAASTNLGNIPGLARSTSWVQGGATRVAILPVASADASAVKAAAERTVSRCKTSDAFFPEERRAEVLLAHPVPLTFRYVALGVGEDAAAIARQLESALRASLEPTPSGGPEVRGLSERPLFSRPPDPDGVALVDVCFAKRDGAETCVDAAEAEHVPLEAPEDYPSFGAATITRADDEVDLDRAEKLLEVRADVLAKRMGDEVAQSGRLATLELLAALLETRALTATDDSGALRRELARRLARHATEADQALRALLAPLGPLPDDRRRLNYWLVQRTHGEREGAFQISTGLVHLALARTSSGAAQVSELEWSETYLGHARWITRRETASRALAGLAVHAALGGRAQDAAELCEDALVRTPDRRPPLVLVTCAELAAQRGATQRASRLLEEARDRERSPAPNLVRRLVELRVAKLTPPAPERSAQ